MLFTIEGNEITKVPHRRDFDAVLRMLGDERAEEVRQGLIEIIDSPRA